MSTVLKKSDERMLERRRQQTQETENVRVVCRLRPLLAHELDARAQDAVQVGTDSKSVHVHVPEDEPQPRRTDFKLDEVLDGSFDQEATFEQSGVKDLLDSALEGFSATVFAYGQTGSGKTYTMAGQDADAAAYHPACFDGVIPRAVRYIFEQVEERRATAKSVCALSRVCRAPVLTSVLGWQVHDSRVVFGDLQRTSPRSVEHAAGRTADSRVPARVLARVLRGGSVHF
jgi:hypothetical protein